MNNEDTTRAIGNKLPPSQGRDAVHIAVMPAIASQHFRPGEHVGIDATGRAIQDINVQCVGIIDPYLTACVVPGDRLFVFLYPGSITSLRHEWSHPTIDAEPTTISHAKHLSKSEQWIADHAEELGLAASALMRDAERWLQGEDFTVQQGSEEWRDNFNPKEFWHHYEIVTGKVVDDKKKQSFYCCSC